MNTLHVNIQTLRTHFSQVHCGVKCQKQVKEIASSSCKQEHRQHFSSRTLKSLKHSCIPSLNSLICEFIDSFLTFRGGCCCYFSALLMSPGEKAFQRETGSIVSASDPRGTGLRIKLILKECPLTSFHSLFKLNSNAQQYSEKTFIH